MSIFFYNIFLWLFRAGMHLASLFHPKAKKWVSGRKGIMKKLEQAIGGADRVIWMHCASLGEFEQGRPVIEALRKKYPSYRVLLTFFSPSGYEPQKHYTGADWVFYLPLDGPRTAKRFLEIVRPSLVIFVKYEFWYYYLKKIKYRDIPLLLISALFREDMTFFKWYGVLQRKMLSRFNHLFVQNARSKELIVNIGLSSICSVSGDTRFDRVLEIADNFKPVLMIEEFAAGKPLLVAGSTWPEDEEALKLAVGEVTTPFRLILAPHEINEKHLASVKKLFPESIFYSDLIAGKANPGAEVLIIDNIGMLSRLYRYAFITYVGGGLKTKGLHNVLEAAVYGKPVLFGMNYSKFTEAVELVKAGGGLPFLPGHGDGRMLAELLKGLLINKDDYAFSSHASKEFVKANAGATEKILQYIQENRLLTS